MPESPHVAGVLERLRTAEYRAVGANQTVKAIRRGRAVLVVVAADADRRVVQEVLAAGRERGLEVVEAGTMQELGRACGIAVGASAAAVLAPPDAPAADPSYN
ncbi:MAG TPA: ribosomal L7Ae/L30e/S12e/Gadd45 family protein [bacterium]|nr:ribosomal L7Ae/L30e/S12e/Gadd45 family protein [bacterium]